MTCSNPFTGRYNDIQELKPLVVELRQSANGIYYIMINGQEKSNTLTLDYNLALKFYDLATGNYTNNKAEDVIIKSNVETTN